MSVDAQSSASTETDQSMSLEVGVPVIAFGANAFENPPLLSEPYDRFNADQIRKECTRRSIRTPNGTNKANRIIRLRAYDALQEAYLTAMGRPLPVNARSSKPRRTPSCAFRLLNILFSGKFSDDFADTGNTLDREEIDAKKARVDQFWKDVCDDSQNERHLYNDLIAPDESLFKGINPATIVLYNVESLIKLWKDVNRQYVEANIKFRQSGTHERDFKNFVQSADTLYLWYWLQGKKDLTTFVNGGVLEQDQFDSIAQQLNPTSAAAGMGGALQPRRSPRKRQSTERYTETPSKRQKPAPASRRTPPRTTPPKRRPPSTHESAASQVHQVGTLVETVERYIAVRAEAHAQEMQEAREPQRAGSSVEERVAMIKLHSDLRKIISSTKDDLVVATGEEEERLREDLELYLKQRRRLTEQLMEMP